MRKIVHISDLHFGRIDSGVVAAMAVAISAVNPEIVIVSGDLTQRARKKQFLEAVAFINALPGEKIIVPGNHDIPTYNWLARMLNPFHRYRRYVSTNLEPFYHDSEVAILGLNTVRKTKYVGGKMRARHARLIARAFMLVNPDLIRILVAHHPFDLPEHLPGKKIIRGADKRIQHIVSAQIDLILGGHMHVSHVRSIAERYKIDGKAALVVQAATVSKRGRGEEPTFNLIKISGTVIDISRFVYSGTEFVQQLEERYQYAEGSWKKI